ncbi:MAG: DUF4159 domain-containing protein [Alphaproteobacteria bacterium]|nr:DUF4159 domain-containing protein [Alphaproteobacteria bacterium]
MDRAQVMLELGPIAFASPAMLLALLLLPALWWLLRITPPMPRILRFPPIRLLFGLQSKEETPAAAPLWLILLRLTMAAALMIGLAHPLLNPGGALTGNGALMLVVDDGWAAAADWDKRREALIALIDRAERTDRPVVLLPTAPNEAGQAPAPSGMLRAAEARNLAGALQPKPWPVDRVAAVNALSGLDMNEIGLIVWLSDGLQDPGSEPLAQALRRMAKLHVLTESALLLPPVVLPPDPGAVEFAATVRRAATGPSPGLRLRAIAEDGRVVAGEDVRFESGKTAAKVIFSLPVELRNEVVRIEIENAGTAGGVALLDDRWRRRPVGLVSASPLDADLSLLDELYYIERALAPYGEVRRAPLDELMAANRAAIAVPDGHTLVSTEAQALNRWIEQGGLVLRFAGPRMAQAEDDGMSPVRLRSGGRALGGAMLWTEPAQLAPFAEGSPFHGLAIPRDVRVARQVLAEPSLELPAKTWARLQDGTPLVTAERRGQGWLVLVHTTANPDWSNLAMSGLFVEMLARTVAMSRGVGGESASRRPLPPLEVLDGAGRLTRATPAAVPIRADAFDAARPGPRTPPGYYGTEAERRALNLGPSLGDLKPLALPAGISSSPYFEATEFDLMPWLLAAALILLLADGLATLVMRGFARALQRRPALATAALAAIAAGGLMLSPDSASAQGGKDPDVLALEATLQTRLAYVMTGVESIDNTSRAGLDGLTLVLKRRTAVEAGPPLGVDVTRNELAFFPLLYWPIAQEQAPLSPETVARVNRYLENGGTILFDTRDGSYGGAGVGPGTQHLRAMARGLDIPRLLPVPVDHVLTKAFYLTQEFPGRWAGDRVWVEQPGERVNDGVSRVIVGGNDWAAAWAIDESGLPVYPAVPGGEAQREMAFRFGVNLVMYTLTGNYKSDQVHVPAILERLGQ